MNQLERAQRAATFRAVLEDGVIKDTLDNIEGIFTDQWKSAQTVEERENCHKTIKIIGMLRQHMASIANSERGEVPHHSVTAIRRA